MNRNRRVSWCFVDTGIMALAETPFSTEMKGRRGLSNKDDGSCENRRSDARADIFY